MNGFRRMMRNITEQFRPESKFWARKFYPWLWWIPACVLKSSVDLNQIVLVFNIIDVSCNNPLQTTPRTYDCACSLNLYGY